jgi:hypothetical protein
VSEASNRPEARALAPWGIEKFGDRLDAELVSQIEGWSDHPELRSLWAELHAHTKPKSFFDTYAEALVARHLLAAGCDLRFEVPTPSGKRADFEVTAADQVFYLHVKRINTERPFQRRLSVSSRLRYLERIERPYVVSVRWRDDLDDEQMHRFVVEAANFIKHARVGDEMLVRGEAGKELGGIQVVAPWEGSHVHLTIGLPSGFVDHTLHLRKVMKKAHRQFMPRHVNIILVGTSHQSDVDDLETALLGTHIERWDAFPPRGRRVAHGRDADGFWNGRRNGESQAAGWFWFTESQSVLQSRFWLRPGHTLAPAMADLLSRLFEGDGG